MISRLDGQLIRTLLTEKQNKVGQELQCSLSTGKVVVVLGKLGGMEEISPKQEMNTSHLALQIE